MKLVVVDYESGNLRSVSRALESFGVEPLVSGDPKDLTDADAVKEGFQVDLAAGYIAGGRPYLGVCLGLQLLLDWTDEEGGAPCLGIVPGQVRRLPESNGGPALKIPHMGWNSVALNAEHPALSGIDSGSYFYFVHSFYAEPSKSAGVLGTTEYGLPFCSVYAKNNVVATQFHPEKSGPVGLRIYRNFVTMAANRSATP